MKTQLLNAVRHDTLAPISLSLGPCTQVHVTNLEVAAPLEGDDAFGHAGMVDR